MSLEVNKNEEKEEKENNEEEADNEVLNFNEPSFSFIPKGGHDWKQEGPYLICRGYCELEHATFIGMDKVLVGINENGPILKARF